MRRTSFGQYCSTGRMPISVRRSFAYSNHPPRGVRMIPRDRPTCHLVVVLSGFQGMTPKARGKNNCTTVEPDTLVSADTFVQWPRLCASGLITAVDAWLMQISANRQSHIHRDSCCTSEKPSRILLARDLPVRAAFLEIDSSRSRQLNQPKQGDS